MIINTRNYQDFKSAVNSLRKIDSVLYNQAVSIPSGTAPSQTVAYAFDLERNQCVFLSTSAEQFVASDFPQAIQISSYILVSEESTTSANF